MFLVLVATIGLLLRLELARRMLVILSGITIVLSVVLVLGFMGLQNRLKDHRQRYDTAVAQLNERSLNATQKQQLDSLTKQLDTLEKQVGKAMQLTYIKYGLTIVAYAGAMVYLTRPGVRQSFRKDL
jgi:Tfp pilus assembly protein PilO